MIYHHHPHSEEAAAVIAKELYDAGVGRLVGVDPHPFIRTLSTINHIQYEAINAQYKDHKLLADISVKFSADFEKVALALCTNKYDFLAKRLESFFKNYGSGRSKEGICR